ncbi:MAG: 50S ribosomal protein L23, large subunit ribosomal protein L23 [Microgenomates group bacterium GW2011_GWC1_41_20]|uniref:50S ribosomal protein L23 n=6 Tax=Candidatus Woeseibacteriota TaxID=1752722 RepID=A0A0G0RUL5_9BACT|nr:MAG: 50S ribosomal protein L23 [Candidatus Woesebacteria bacterium GW2011_GWB1_40_12]KKR56248.1 MAG: 50S ribosomal protein L23 [Candidatus Woesebacteria bacterium GW2011_GWF1_40_24]KKR90755.1 MAG: 50S ribosomal protein L23 [Candidatus Woesebacteria bacterium GW2011_GWD1_41_12]KKS00773.1 MAG: 50S ribosomal protein L23, large subunit ribosomal protein L23 [Microgenomates group bacterium GW2011_GWC1_41_20]KKS05788.1 MAG: 50S ribosomal protein L23 [Candidatus Woesebacteria bacterium GW2011_GWE1_
MKPIFTEKSLREAKLGNYTFQVSPTMDKKQIAAKIAQLFGVKVVGVRTTRTGSEKGKNARGKKFSIGAVKKAIVILKSGDKIDIFEEGKK